jgi:hypothetical protein
MPWQVEQNTGVNDRVIRCIWWKGYIYAFTEDAGVWRRDGVGPWTQVFVNGNNGGQAWLWEEDDATYCGGGALNGSKIYRSVDGTNWTVDVDLNVAFGLQGFYHNYSEIGGYGDYLYVANHDVGISTTFFYRRDLAGNWIAHSTHVGVEGAGGRGIVGFGGEIYWTNWTEQRYWDGAAWSVEPTLTTQCGSTCYLSVIDDALYVLTSTSASLIGGYYWRTAMATDWSFLNLPVPDNTWGGWTLCQGEDGEAYTIAQDGTTLRIYQKVGPLLDLIHYQATVGVGLGTRGGVCTDATGEMFFGTRAGGTVQFFAFAGNYNVTPGGLYPQAVDCDGDGDALYVALYDTTTAQPMLISVPLPLIGGVSAGSNIFNPGAGTAINVKCPDVGDQAVVAGDFGNNEQVETTDDAGLNWTDIDRDAWGAETAQPLEINPISIEEVLVALAAAQDITETFDAGATAWVVNNAAVGYSPGAMSKLPGGDELVIGDDAANRIDYSPNRGVTLQNITGAFAGNVAALEVA